jgi:SAM-dependent methyltransferase
MIDAIVETKYSTAETKCELLNTYEILEHVMGMKGLHPHCIESINKLRNRLAQHVEQNISHSNGVVLDIGCGSGAGTADLARLIPSIQVIGLDINKSAIETGIMQHAPVPNLEFLHGDLDTFMQLNPHTRIIGVMCVSVSMFINDVEGFYEKIYNALDDRGIFIDAPFMFRDDATMPDESFRQSTYSMCGCNMEMYKISQLRDKIQHAGFKSVDSSENSFELMNMSKLFRDYSPVYLFSNFFRNMFSPPSDLRSSSSWYIFQRTVKIFYFFFRNRRKYGSGELVAIKY